MKNPDIALNLKYREKLTHCDAMKLCRCYALLAEQNEKIHSELSVVGNYIHIRALAASEHHIVRCPRRLSLKNAKYDLL